MGQTAFMLMLVTILSKVFGFLRESVMAYYYGAGDIVAIYAVANTLPVVIANFVASGIIYGFIPIYIIFVKIFYICSNNFINFIFHI